MRLAKKTLAADVPFEHLARGLALAEPGDFYALCEAFVRLIQGALHLLGVDLDFEEHLALREALRGYLHNPIIASALALETGKWQSEWG